MSLKGEKDRSWADQEEGLDEKRKRAGHRMETVESQLIFKCEAVRKWKKTQREGGTGQSARTA